MILFLSPSPSLDATIEVPSLTPGEIARTTRVIRVAGGKALNAARVARQLGSAMHTIVALGGPSGDWCAALLADDLVPATRIDLAAPTRMCSAIIVGAGATESTDIYEAPTPFTAAEWDAFRSAALEATAALQPSHVAFSGSLPEGIDPDDMAALLATLRAETRVVIDTSGDSLAATIASANLVKINRHEASELLSTEYATAQTACQALAEEFGVDAIVTDGIRGAAAVVGGETAVVGPPQFRGTFPAGSGDAFLGGFLAATDRGEGLDEALATAANASMSNALTAGQGILATAYTPL